MQSSLELACAPQASVFICIPGDPVGKQSVRVSMVGGFARKYMPEKTREYEAKCAVEGKLSMRGREVLTGPICLKMQIFLPIPNSWSKKKKEAARLGLIVPTKKPDTSNILKAVEDGFTGNVWHDDCQVVDHQITKRFGEEPCVIAIITALDLKSC
jgi:Holliday junction resolvase RusA-like endonuclease